MRYYVTSVEFNKQAQAENRTVPFGFDTLDAAKQKYYSVLASDIGNESVGWCNVILWDKYGNVVMKDYWVETPSAEPVNAE